MAAKTRLIGNIPIALPAKKGKKKEGEKQVEGNLKQVKNDD